MVHRRKSFQGDPVLINVDIDRRGRFIGNTNDPYKMGHIKSTYVKFIYRAS